jgi:putative SOS response-associated peptidase YedK
MAVASRSTRVPNPSCGPTFRAAYAKRRCIVPVDCFFEWRAVKGARAKRPFAVAMEDRAPFAIGGLWESWHHPQSGEWIRTVAIVTVKQQAPC